MDLVLTQDSAPTSHCLSQGVQRTAGQTAANHVSCMTTPDPGIDCLPRRGFSPDRWHFRPSIRVFVAAAATPGFMPP